MAVYWVQHYYTLPIIFEDFGMGEETSLRQNPMQQDSDERLTTVQPTQGTIPAAGQAGGMDFEPYPRQHFSLGNYGNTGQLDMSAMASALPDYQMRQFQQQPYSQHYQSSVAPNTSMMYQYQQGAQFAGQTVPTIHPSFAQQYPSQYAPGAQTRQQQSTPYAHHIGNAGPQSTHQSFQGQQFLVHQPPFHGNLASQQTQHQQPGFQSVQGNPYMTAFATRVPSGYALPQLRLDNSLAQTQPPPMYQQINPLVRRSSSNSSLQTSSALRGPPRKPRQSGYALWVGNLPPATHILDLKDHFARDAMDDIESVFLISKSNCAFVNYKTEASCAAAMTRFHDSRFQGVRLVCRLRRGSTSTPTPTQSTSEAAVAAVPEVRDTEVSAEVTAADTTELTPEPEPIEKVKEKFFVVKSLTVEDLERSVTSNIWATQAHNESTLNKAWQTAENVYLVFSANKSGEYFGYARMETAIDDESVTNIEAQPQPEVREPGAADLPMTIPTPASATAPKGRIIDDSARGTIFWEAENGMTEKDDQAHNTDDDAGNTSGEGYESASPATPQAFGKPFKIKWMSTDRLPFYRTRGLRNPWNANREVKIARDGTEIEPGVGRRLVNMFHRPQNPSLSPDVGRNPHFPPQGSMAPGFMQAPPGGMYGRGY